MQTSNVLEVRRVAVGVPGRVLFADLTFSLERGESVAIMGPSGVGKSSLLAAILGLRPVASGSIHIVGTRVDNASTKAKLALRRDHIGMVFQHGELLDELSAVENVAVPAMIAGVGGPESLGLAAEALAVYGVPRDTLAADLSGGERQRTALARAMVMSPSLVLADEPTAALDSETKQRIAVELFSTVKGKDCGLLVATHDHDLAAMADRVIDLSQSAPHAAPA